MLDLDKIKTENARRKDHMKRGSIPTYSEPVEDTIDVLVAEVERLTAELLVWQAASVGRAQTLLSLPEKPALTPGARDHDKHD